MKVIFSIIYVLYFAVQAYYTQADHLAGDAKELWGKIWLMSHDTITLFLIIVIVLKWYDKNIINAAKVAGLYQLSRLVFDTCWLYNIASTYSIWWQIYFFALIFIMNLILFTNGRIFKR